MRWQRARRVGGWEGPVEFWVQAGPPEEQGGVLVYRTNVAPWVGPAWLEVAIEADAVELLPEFCEAPGRQGFDG